MSEGAVTTLLQQVTSELAKQSEDERKAYSGTFIDASNKVIEAAIDGLHEVTVRAGDNLDYLARQFASGGFKVKVDIEPLRITIYWGNNLKQCATQ